MLYTPENLDDLLEKIDKKDGKKLFLAGGTDINVLIKKSVINPDDEIFYINDLVELKGIYESEDKIKIGAITTYREIIDSDILKKYISFFSESLEHFASPLIQTMATIGGNIANGSPTNDVSPLLLVLDAVLILKNKYNERTVPIKDFYTGYKKNILKDNEIIKEIQIEKTVQKGYITYYNKVASRDILAISKLSLAGLKKHENDIISDLKLSVGSLNEYPRRLFLLEDYLTNKSIEMLDFSQIRDILKREITPISDFRSDKEYRFEVCQNLIIEFLSKS